MYAAPEGKNRLDFKEFVKFCRRKDYDWFYKWLFIIMNFFIFFLIQFYWKKFTENGAYLRIHRGSSEFPSKLC